MIRRTVIYCAFLCIQVRAGAHAQPNGSMHGDVERSACSIKVTAYGAAGDGRMLDTASIQRALDDCARLGGGKVLFPKGTYRSGTVHLRSNVSLVLEQGAVLRGSENLDDYLEPLTRTSGDNSHFVAGTASRRLFLYGDHVNKVAIEGDGIIDGNRVREKNGDRGPLGILFQHSSNIVLRGVTVTNTPGWAVTFFDCRNVRLLGTRLKNVMVDGINPVSCQNVLYDGVEIDGTGDDPICIKNEGPPLEGGFVTRNIVVRNTTVKNTTHAAIKIGTGTHGIFEDILVENCTFDLPGDLFAIQLMRPSLPGENDRHIRNVTLRQLDVRNAARVFNITAMGVERPVIDGLRFEDIRFRGKAVDSKILGIGTSPVRNVFVDSLDVEASQGAPVWLRLSNVHGFQMRNSRLTLPKTGSAVEAQSSSGLSFAGVSLAGIDAAGPAFLLKQLQHARFSSVVAPRIENLVHVTGAATSDVRLEGSIPENVKVPLLAGAEVPEGALYPAAQVDVVELNLPTRLAPNLPVEASAKAVSRGETGAARVALRIDEKESGAVWAWVAPSAAVPVRIKAEPLYQPRVYRIQVGAQSRKLRILNLPAAFRYGAACQIEAPRLPGGATRISVPVQNVGSTAGKDRVVLRSMGAVVASKEVVLGPGERSDVQFEQVFRGPWQVADFPEWNLSTFSNVPAKFLLYRDKVVIEAQGRRGEWSDYAAAYLPAVEGDFDAKVRIVAVTETIGEYAAAGLIVRNQMSDIRSGGLSMNFRVPKYGGYKIWSWDADGDGSMDTRSDGGQSRVPVWYRLEKRGQTIRAFHSADGKSWKLCGRAGRQEFTAPHIGKIQDVGFYANAWSNQGDAARVEFQEFSVKRLP
jgi:regulation of enolase protein 1 (concanavalin A-like superfamily)